MTIHAGTHTIRIRESAVHWDDQTYDEMTVGFFDLAVSGNLGKNDYFSRRPMGEEFGSEPSR